MTDYKEKANCEKMERLTAGDQTAKGSKRSNHFKSIMFAVIAGVCFAFCNSLFSIPSQKYGGRGMLPSWLANLIIFITFHVVRMRWPNLEPEASFSIYYQTTTTQVGSETITRTELIKSKAMMPFVRSFFSLFSLGCINLSFKYFQESGSTMNPGIITVLFTLNLVFASITFFILFKQKLTSLQLFGMLMIVISTVLVAIGSKQAVISSSVAQTAELKLQTLTISIVFAISTAVFFTVNLTLIKLMLSKFKFPPMQLSFDVCFAQFLVYFVLWLIDVFVIGTEYDWFSFAIYNLAMAMGSIGAVFIALALKYGSGGIVTAFENLKVLWTVVIMTLVSGG